MLTIIGGGGIPNYGDELIIGNWLKWYVSSHNISSEEITVEAYRSVIVRNLFEDKFPGVNWSHSVKDARLEFRNLDFWGALEKGMDAANSSIPAVNKAFTRVNKSSLIHVHGGGYFNGMWPSHAFVLGLVSAAQSSSGAHAVATGLGVGPLEDPSPKQRSLLDRAVEAFDFIEVRDSSSYNFLKRSLSRNLSGKIILGLDDAFLYPVESANDHHKTLHLALRDDSAAEKIIERLTSQFIGRFDRHRFWVCHPAADAGAYAKLVKRFRRFEVAGVSELIRDPHLGSQDLLITERFHPHLQAARVGAGGIFSSGSEYYDAKHGSLVDLGSPFIPDGGREFGEVLPTASTSVIAEDDPKNVFSKQSLARQIMKLI
ncbi:polysaccharide pyruvyl transferase family protein [Nesterenkonia halotolerans]|uniref:polysaccharide pyruvyl transferase family protein n=1 Tax=Nesterenkonia halotolerans TaxID=225325 RepID=UPI003EE5CD53